MKVQNVLLSLAIAALLASPAFAQRNSDSSDRSDRSDRSAHRDSSTSKSDKSDKSDRDADKSSRDSSRDSRDDSSQRSDKHAGLGVTLSEDSDGRVLIDFVVPGSPAARAGLQARDELLKLDGDKVTSADEVIDDVRDKDPGAQISLQIRRNGKKQDLKAKLVGAREAFENARNRSSGDENYSRDDMNQRNRAWSQDRDSQAGRDDQGQRQFTSGRGGLEGMVYSLQQQVSELRREVQQLRREQGTSSYRAGYRGTQGTQQQGVTTQPAPVQNAPSYRNGDSGNDRSGYDPETGENESSQDRSAR